MKKTDIEIANQLLESLKRLDGELTRIDQLAARLSTEGFRVCCKFQLITEEQHQAEIDGYRGHWTSLDMAPSSLHAHCSESEMLEMFGIMVAWRKAERKEIVRRLRNMGITND